MAITNGYASLAEVRAALYNDPVTASTAQDSAIETAVQAVSRQIDGWCGRRFWKNTTDEVRIFTPDDHGMLFTDDIVSVTTLKTDDDADGTFETSWLSSDYALAPLNAALRGKPYTMICTKPNGTHSFPHVYSGVEITGVFGWNAVPDPIKEACILQTIRIFKRPDAPFGVAGIGDMGTAVRVMKFDPDVQALIAPFRRAM